MAITINPRASWGQYAPWYLQKHASDPPEASKNPAWHGDRGVFLHYLGPGSTADLRTEEDCRKEIAEVYLQHKTEGQFEGDIAYNYLVCQHGHIYEGAESSAVREMAAKPTRSTAGGATRVSTRYWA